MKKILSILLLILLVVPSALALSLPAPFYGQDQYYYVVFDKEGEASVVARFDIQDTKDLENLELEIPGEDIRIISVVQEYWTYSIGYNGYERRDYPVKYEEIYYEADTLSDSVTLSFDIPHTPRDSDPVTILVYYKVSDYVDQTGGIYKYDFETITNQYDTNSIRVSIDVAEDLYLKGSDAEIEYRDNTVNSVGSAELGTEDMAMVASSIRYVQSGYIETASSLDPYESFHVTGKYSNSWWTVNWWKPVLTIFGILAVLAGIGLLFWRLANKKKKVGFSVSVGVASGILIGLSWLVTGYLLQNPGLFGYNVVMPLFVLLLALMVNVFLFVGPALLIGWQKGVKYGVYCFIATVVSAFVIVLVGLIIFAFLSMAPVRPHPVYY